jgi:hypothetical protein
MDKRKTLQADMDASDMQINPKLRNRNGLDPKITWDGKILNWHTFYMRFTGWMNQAGLGYMANIYILTNYITGGYNAVKGILPDEVHHQQFLADQSVLYGAFQIAFSNLSNHQVDHFLTRYNQTEHGAYSDGMKVLHKCIREFEGHKNIPHRVDMIQGEIDNERYDHKYPGGMRGYATFLNQKWLLLERIDPEAKWHTRPDERHKTHTLYNRLKIVKDDFQTLYQIYKEWQVKCKTYEEFIDMISNYQAEKEQTAKHSLNTRTYYITGEDDPTV